MDKKFKSGFISILGRPNVGKSSLLNFILEKKISIVTDKPQTTRNKITGILTTQDCQYIFFDTPGVHTSKNELDKIMNKAALKSSKGVDLILVLAPINERVGKNDIFLSNVVKEMKDTPVFLVITKTDLLSEKDLKNKIEEWTSLYDGWKKIIPVSVVNGENIGYLLSEINNCLPETGIKYYPDEMSSDQPERFVIREFIREEILIQTQEEVPHSVAILIDKFEENKKILKIIASIVCERDSQKGIIIGNKGSMIKKIGVESRKKLEEFFGVQVYLELFVKTSSNWRKSAGMIKKLGYDGDMY